MKHFSTLCLTLFGAIAQICALNFYNTNPLLLELDAEIQKSEQYIQLRLQAIDSAKVVFFADTCSYEAAFAVAQLYAPYQCDSAIEWFGRASRLSEGEMPEDDQLTFRRCVGRKEGVDVPFPYDSIFPEELSHTFAINACLRGHALLRQNDTIGAIEWLAKSALADVKLGITDNEASWQLAKLLSEQPEGPNIVRAYDYIEYSCRNEDIFKAELRYKQIGPIAHVIAEKFRAMIGKEYLALGRAFVAILIFAILLLAAIVMLFIYIRKLTLANREMKIVNEQLDKANKELDNTNKELDISNKELNEMNKIREHFICSYLEEKSADLHQFYKETQKAGSTASEELFRQRLEEYYHSFDTTFLRLYPQFVDHINSLIRLDAQFAPPKGTLTPELRIFALIRLGITRSTRISELLCLSANTVYSYRSRVKNLCTGDREKFEDAIRNI